MWFIFSADLRNRPHQNQRLHHQPPCRRQWRGNSSIARRQVWVNRLKVMIPPLMWRRPSLSVTCCRHLLTAWIVRCAVVVPLLFVPSAATLDLYVYWRRTVRHANQCWIQPTVVIGSAVSHPATCRFLGHDQSCLQTWTWEWVMVDSWSCVVILSWAPWAARRTRAAWRWLLVGAWWLHHPFSTTQWRWSATERGLSTPTEDGVINLGFSFDGSWMTRGHNSKYGLGCVIDSPCSRMCHHVSVLP